MAEFSRRSFLGGVAAATAAAVPLVTIARKAAAGEPAQGGAAEGTRFASLIDVSRCDGCPDRGTPRCVAACRVANQHRFPEPDPASLKDYWPQKQHEDWSDKREVTDRLTPYNWTFVQSVEVEHEGETRRVHVPRRCMHCDNPVCVKMCPFGAMQKTAEGPTQVLDDLCLGGAKCRTVCPWDVPQRQAGVGIYTYMDPLPVGGGVMYKCDLCRDQLLAGGTPACASACPRDAIVIGEREAVFAEAERRARSLGGDVWERHLYGRDEHGGTSTLYVSAIPFDIIDAAIVEQAEKKKAKVAARDPEQAARIRAMRMHGADNMLERHAGLAALSVGGPLLGMAAAFAATASKLNKSERAARAAEPVEGVEEETGAEHA